MRYSKQREAVYDVLCNTTAHPDVAWIYGEVKKLIPNISLATVYRNLGELEILGKIKRVSVEGYSERYDANVCDHAHIVCESCGRIDDADMSRVTVCHKFSNVTRCEVTFYGKCDECRKRTKGGNLQ